MWRFVGGGNLKMILISTFLMFNDVIFNQLIISCMNVLSSITPKTKQKVN